MKSNATKINFTKAAIEALDPPAPPAERRYVYDLKTPGLTLSVFASGKKVFYLYRKARQPDGTMKPERVKLGVWPITTVEQARDDATKQHGKIISGENPNAERRARRSSPTLKEAFDVFIEEPTRTRAKRPKAPKTVKDYGLQFDGYLAHWHQRQLAQITRVDIEKLHNELGSTKGTYTANRVLQLLRAIFNSAIDGGRFPTNPAARIRLFEEHERDRFLEADELPRFWKALEAEPSEKVRDFILLALFTGQRRGNVASMKWADVNLDTAVWKLPHTKTGKHTAPLSDEAVTILKRRRANAGDCEFVFPAHHGGGHLKDPMRGWRDILERAGITDLRIHDLRRSIASWQTMTGSTRAVVGALLGHRDEQTTAIYARLDQSTVRKSLKKATAAMVKAARKTAKAG